MARLPASPTPKNFADGVVALVEPIAAAMAGADRRVTKTEVRDGARRGRVTQEESELAGETVLRRLKSSGSQRPTVSATVEGIGRRALRAGKKAAGGDNRISMDDAIGALPSDLAKLFVHLRHPPPSLKPKKPKPGGGGGELPSMPPPASGPAAAFESANAAVDPIVLGQGPDAVALGVRPLRPELVALAAAATAGTGRAFSFASYQADPATLQAILADPQRLAAFAGQVLTDPKGQGHPEEDTANGAQATTVQIAPQDATRTFDLAVFARTMREDPEVYMELSPVVQPLPASVVQGFDFGAHGKLLALHWHNGDETTYEGLLAVNPDTGAMRTVAMKD